MATKRLFITGCGATISVIKLPEGVINEDLAPAIYRIGYDEKQKSFHLEYIKDYFELPNKMYGSIHYRTNKITNTFINRNKSTGVLLTGDKGSGKTLLTQNTCNKLLKENKIPVVLLDESFNDFKLISFINDIGACILLIDEFGKIFSKHKANHNNVETKMSQEDFLTLLDGNYTEKRLVLFTENSIDLINDFLINRPGRIFYHFKYECIEDNAIVEFCKDNNISEEFSLKILQYKNDKLPNMSFDMFKAIIEEYQMYRIDDIDDIIMDLNITSNKAKYIVTPQKLIIGHQVKCVSENSFDLISLFKFEASVPFNNTEEWAQNKFSKEIDNEYYFDTISISHKTNNIVVYKDMMGAELVCKYKEINKNELPQANLNPIYIC